MTFARVRAIIAVSVLFVTASVVVIMAIGRDSQNKPVSIETCASGMVPVKLKMPQHSSAVTLNIYNGTKLPDLARRVADDFSNRGFKIGKVSTAPGNKIYNSVADIYFGPSAFGAGYLVSAHFLVDNATLHFETKRTGGDVDVIIGTGFQQLATENEFKQSVAAIGEPTLPAGTCAAG